MGKDFYRIARGVIYTCYAFLLCWMIYFYNQEIFYSPEELAGKNALVRYMPSVVLLMFSALLYANLFFKEKKILVLDCFLTASILFLYNSTASLIMATTLLLFGLIMAFF